MRERRTKFVSPEGWAAFLEFKAGITGRKGESAVAREVKRLGAPALHDVILEDERGLTQIDHVVRGPDAVLVLETKTLGGRISGTPLCATWTQYLGEGERETVTAFQSPLWQNLRHVRAVEAVVAPLGVPVSGHVVLAGRATLPEELRPITVPLEKIGRLFVARSPTAPAAMDMAWAALVAAASSGEARRDEHAEALRRRRAAREF